MYRYAIIAQRKLIMDGQRNAYSYYEFKTDVTCMARISPIGHKNPNQSINKSINQSIQSINENLVNVMTDGSHLNTNVA